MNLNVWKFAEAEKIVTMEKLKKWSVDNKVRVVDEDSVWRRFEEESESKTRAV